MARAGLGLSALEFSKIADVSQPTFLRIEKDPNAPALTDTLKKIHSAFERLGVEFIGNDGVRIVVPAAK